VPFLVIVPREELMGQWASMIVNFTNIRNGNIGFVQQSRCDYENKSACVGMIHSICKDKYPDEFKNHFGLVIYDESHLVPATTFSETAGMFPAKYRCGLSATLSRSDGMIDVLYNHLGKNIIQAKKSFQPKPKIGIYKYNGKSGRFPHWVKDKLQARAWILSQLAANKERNQIIAYFANLLIEKGIRTLVIGERIHQLEEIEYILNYKYNQRNLGLYISSTNKSRKHYLLKESDCILATTKMLDVGIDEDTLRGLVFATPLSDCRQVVGRVRRINDTLPDPIVVDIVDLSYPQTKGWANKRMQWYNESGFPVHEISI
jgi:superfamily II DNA or RNA helicase